MSKANAHFFLSFSQNTLFAVYNVHILREKNAAKSSIQCSPALLCNKKKAQRKEKSVQRIAVAHVGSAHATIPNNIEPCPASATKHTTATATTTTTMVVTSGERIFRANVCIRVRLQREYNITLIPVLYSTVPCNSKEKSSIWKKNSTGRERMKRSSAHKKSCGRSVTIFQSPLLVLKMAFYSFATRIRWDHFLRNNPT